MQRRIPFFTLLGDAGALILGFVVASRIVFDTWLPWKAPLHGGDSIWSLLLQMVGGLFLGSYISLRMWHRGARRPAYGRGIAVVAAAVTFTMASIVVTRGYWSRAFLGWTSVVWLGGALALRWGMRRRPWSESLVTVTDEKRLVADLEMSPHLDILEVLEPAGNAPPHLRPGATLALDFRAVLSDRMAQFVASWSLSGAPVRSISAIYEEHLGRLPLMHLSHGWELTTPVEKNDYGPLKRTLDIALVTLTAPLWLPLAGLIWAGVRLDSPGRVIYRQTRVGRNGRHFILRKFRTMIDNAEENGPQFADPEDGRLTRVGRLLRRFRFDEIPQLWNVLKGDLSLVGPRPERPFFVAEFEREIPFYSYRTLVRPGVTGWAQVNYGYADDVADTVEKLTFDLYYVKHMSLWLDLQILGKSVWTVLSGFGAR